MEIQFDETQSSGILDLFPLDVSGCKQPFISAILILKEQLKEILEAISIDFSSNETQNSTASSILDSFHFGLFYSQLNSLQEQGLLSSMIKERRKELSEQKKHWLPFINSIKIGKEEEFYTQIESILNTGRLIPISSGSGGVYFLVDALDIPQFVVKPVDEDILCLNNRKELGSPFNDVKHRVREEIPLYRSVQIDAFCWEVATLSGLEGITPKTVMGVLNQEDFYDFTMWLENDTKEQSMQETGQADKEKLCSIQEFIPNSRNLIELLHEFYSQGLSDDEIATRFDQSDFEQAYLFVWLSYDTDAHAGNFLSFVKKIDLLGHPVYGIKKIDNSLSFPEKNTQYLNTLVWIPNALLPISLELKRKIANLPVEQIIKKMDQYELTSCSMAFKERVEILKKLSQKEGITLAEIDLRMSLLSREEGKNLVLSPMTTEQILNLLREIPLTKKTS